MDDPSVAMPGGTPGWERHRETVRPEWIDYNGHMNVAYYVLIFDHATDAVLDRLGLGELYRKRAAARCSSVRCT